MKKRVIALALCLFMLLTCLGAGVDVLSGDLVPDEVPTVTEVPDAEPVPTATAAEPDSTLYDKLMACETSDEFEAIAEAAGDEQISALTETELAALEAHYADIYVGVIPETVVFTDAGPFMPAVNVSSTARFRMMRAPAAKEPADNGLALSKTATTNADGSYTIRMEAYTTGKVITSTKTVPVDIVLVLDQSGSMADDFNGNETNTNENRRQYAMKQAVNNFIDKVNEKYSAEADHRMAIVTFGSGASTLQGWTSVDEEGKTTLQGKISGLPNTPKGATNVAAGMTQAETLMGSGYSYTGTNTQRQKVVIVFTDGVPTTESDFDTTVATNAIASAKRLKDAGATVYTVGIFTGANPKELYGASGFDTNSDGSIGSDWSDFSFWMIGDIKSYDIPAGNRFLNYLSSNFTDTTEIGIEKFTKTFIGIGYRGWKITKNFDRTASSYYLTANNSTKLSEIFQTISENIQSANINLGSETVVKDAVSPYFDLPANASGIKLYTAAAKADGTFDTPEDAPAAVVAIVKDGIVSVTGFDFNANFVSATQKPDKTYGKKLIIEFNVTPKDEFLGGNDVPTNDWENTAVYDKDGNEVEKFADANTTPTVDVPIKAVTVTAADKNVYLLDDLTKAQLISGSTVKAGNVTLDLTADNYGLEAWQNAYVNISIDPKDADGTTVSGLNDLKDDTTYSVSVTISPKYEGTAEAAAGTARAKVNVFKPEITFQDSAIDLGDTPDYATENFESVVWKHGDENADNVTMTGNAPELSYTYSPAANAQDAFKTDTYVNVTVKIGDTELSKGTDVTFKHQKIDYCNSNNCSFDSNKGQFIVHIKTFDLTITKSITRNESKLYGSQDFVFNVKCEDKNIDIDVVVNVPDEETRGSVTIKGLPVGTYTITENTGWSWRYELQGAAAPTGATGTVVYNNDGSSATYTPRGTNNQIIFTNNWVQAKWLSFTDSVKNIFGKPNT